MNLYFTKIHFSDGQVFDGFFDADNVSAVDYEHSSGNYELHLFMYHGDNIILYYDDDESGIATMKEEYQKILEAVQKRSNNIQNLT